VYFGYTLPEQGGKAVSVTLKVSEALHEMDKKNLIDQLADGFREKARLLMLGFALYGNGLATVSDGRRSLDQQMVLYGHGRGKAECLSHDVPAIYARPALKRVTWCVPTASRHVKGKAIDVSFAAYKILPEATCRRLAAALDLTWGGDWKVKDCGHFEERS
jgi:hypothetical protein